MQESLQGDSVRRFLLIFLFTMFFILLINFPFYFEDVKTNTTNVSWLSLIVPSRLASPCLDVFFSKFFDTY
jgi:hypothetical protein